MIEDHYQVFEEFFFVCLFILALSSMVIRRWELFFVFFLINDNNKKRDEKNKSRRILFVSGSFKSFFVCLFGFDENAILKFKKTKKKNKRYI